MLGAYECYKVYCWVLMGTCRIGIWQHFLSCSWGCRKGSFPAKGAVLQRGFLWALGRTGRGFEVFWREMKVLPQKIEVGTNQLLYWDHCWKTFSFVFGNRKEKNQGLIVIYANLTGFASQGEIWWVLNLKPLFQMCLHFPCLKREACATELKQYQFAFMQHIQNEKLPILFSNMHSKDFRLLKSKRW